MAARLVAALPVDRVVGLSLRARHPSASSLLPGLYDDAGLLHQVGFTARLHDLDQAATTRRLENLIEPPAARAAGRPAGSGSALLRLALHRGWLATEGHLVDRQRVQRLLRLVAIHLR